MMGDVVDMIAEWLQAVFDVGVEEEEELALGHDSLLLMQQALSAVSESESKYVALIPSFFRRRPARLIASPSQKGPRRVDSLWSPL